ncbi:MAG TPA: multicopper oxidase domain-containing protein [Candidatus Kapabacteria bacterium]|nr:multicopper oxidase domain-containing protein [Candidatus Kapabacteria bacterium]
MRLSRRRFLTGSAVAALAVAAGKKLPLKNKHSALVSGNPLLIPSEISGGNLTIATATAQIFSGSNTNILSINGSYPAPTIRIKKSQTFSAHILNNLADDLVLHWHGQHVPAVMDGHPKYAIKSGQSADITFPVINRAGTYFYHSHTDMMTAEQVYRGLAGMFIVDDDEDGALPLPRGMFDVPLVLSDKRFDTNKQIVYSPTMTDLMNGYVGETILVNGTSDPFLSVASTLYRFRILNASNARIYQIALSDNSSFMIIGSDGGLLETPLSATSCFLSPAERVDVLIDFSKYQTGSSLTLKSLPFSVDVTPYTPLPQGAAFDILRFDINATGNSHSQIPAALSSIIKYSRADAVNTLQFVLGTDGMNHTINSLKFQMDRIDNTIPFNTLEVWTFDNTQTTNIHPMHVHGTQFQVASRSFGDLLSSDSGWKDTVMVRGGEAMDVLVKFADYEGIYLVHCHNLEHEDHGMMSNFLVSKTNSVDQDSSTLAELSVSPNPANDHANIRIPKADSSRTVTITDIHGKKIKQFSVAGDVLSVNVSVRSFPSGEYFIRVDGETVTMQVIH